jgi:hypothetical protein
MGYCRFSPATFRCRRGFAAGAGFALSDGSEARQDRFVSDPSLRDADHPCRESFAVDLLIEFACRGQPKEIPLPIALPPPRPRPTTQKRTFFSIVLQTAMVASALALAYVVLAAEERYALGRPSNPPQAIQQTAAQSPSRQLTDAMMLPRSN